MQVERTPVRLHQGGVSGKRERNTLVTSLALVNNLPKGGLIHDIASQAYACAVKAPAVRERPMAHQLVGGVTAHQGYDGYQA